MPKAKENSYHVDFGLEVTALNPEAAGLRAWELLIQRGARLPVGRVTTLGSSNPSDLVGDCEEVDLQELAERPKPGRPWRVIEQDGGLWHIYAGSDDYRGVLWDGGWKVGRKRGRRPLYLAYTWWAHAPTQQRPIFRCRNFMQAVSRLLRLAR
jgi:hypothetical protein